MTETRTLFPEDKAILTEKKEQKAIIAPKRVALVQPKLGQKVPTNLYPPGTLVEMSDRIYVIGKHGELRKVAER